MYAVSGDPQLAPVLECTSSTFDNMAIKAAINATSNQLTEACMHAPPLYQTVMGTWIQIIKLPPKFFGAHNSRAFTQVRTDQQIL